jgi:phosphoglycolate phosphatase-like HAD superfamily hydrolase
MSPLTARQALRVLALAPVLAPAVARATDALPSWNDDDAKARIVDFVSRVTDSGGPDYLKPEDRIATFDNDGTLWVEKPAPTQFLFVLDRIRALAADHADWQTMEPYASVLRGDSKALLAAGEKGIAALMAATHAGMTTAQFQQIVRDWIRKAQSPLFHRPYTSLVYQPMLELLAYLRSNGFKTYIVSGGGVEFIRAWAEATYDMPPEQVIGSSGKVKYQLDARGNPELVKLAEVEFVDVRAGKPVGINRFIGKRPIVAVGNSDGDREMLEYSDAGPGPRLAVYIHHDDAAREAAYDRGDKLAALDTGWNEAIAKGWLVISMKNDWNTIFPK